MQLQVAKALGLVDAVHSNDDADFLDPDIRFTEDDIKDVSCANILDSISALAVGVWIVAGSVLYFVSLYDYVGEVDCDCHSEINEGLSYQVAGVRMTDSDGNIYETGDTSYTYNTIQVSSKFASEKQVGYASIYTKFPYSTADVDKVYIANNVVPLAPFCFNLSGTEVIGRSTTATIEPYGVVLSVSTNNPISSETGCIGRLTREVDSKVDLNEQMGCCLITPYQGFVWVDE